MHSDPALILAQWFSPAYPVGAFAYSHGLEWAAEAGDVIDADSLGDWLTTVLRHGAGWNDALFLAAAYRATDPAPVDRTARAFAASAERLRETVLQGEAFARATGAVWDAALPPLTYPVAVGRAARVHGLPLEITTRFYLHAFLSNLVAAGQRLAPIGQTDAQRLIRTLTPVCMAVAAAARATDLDALSSSAFLTDIAAMKHETQYARIFRT